MSSPNYGTASIPVVKDTNKQTSRQPTGEAYAALEQRIAEMNEQLVKQNRDNEDYRDNIDESNLSESLLKIIKDLQARVAALEQIINP